MEDIRWVLSGLGVEKITTRGVEKVGSWMLSGTTTTFRSKTLIKQ